MHWSNDGVTYKLKKSITTYPTKYINVYNVVTNLHNFKDKLLKNEKKIIFPPIVMHKILPLIDWKYYEVKYW